MRVSAKLPMDPPLLATLVVFAAAATAFMPNTVPGVALTTETKCNRSKAPLTVELNSLQVVQK